MSCLPKIDLSISFVHYKILTYFRSVVIMKSLWIRYEILDTIDGSIVVIKSVSGNWSSVLASSHPDGIVKQIALIYLVAEPKGKQDSSLSLQPFTLTGHRPSFRIHLYFTSTIMREGLLVTLRAEWKRGGQSGDS